MSIELVELTDVQTSINATLQTLNHENSKAQFLVKSITTEQHAIQELIGIGYGAQAFVKIRLYMRTHNPVESDTFIQNKITFDTETAQSVDWITGTVGHLPYDESSNYVGGVVVLEVVVDGQQHVLFPFHIMDVRQFSPLSVEKETEIYEKGNQILNLLPP